MVIAVTYDDGNVGEHFGHAKHFKLYEMEQGRLLDSAVIQPLGSGHAAMIAELLDYNTDLLICNSIGEAAMEGLRQNGIVVCAGVTGNADDAVAAFTEGRLTFQTTGGCAHHEGGHSCCGHSGGCGAPGGCCH